MGNEQISLTAAECAARTGLTVKALRVYERYGLIVPRRTANGWRHYGTQELARLNTITVLKTTGLTLVQIRELINDKNPSLPQVLRAQIEAWKARKADADRAQALAEIALQRVQTEQSLSVEELCRLVRNFESGDANPAVRQALDRHLTTEEQQEVVASSWWKDWETYQQAQRIQIYPELKKFRDAGLEPTSPEVQQVVYRNNLLVAQYKIRELSVHARTYEHSKKAVRARLELSLQAQSRPTDSALSRYFIEPELADYFNTAMLQSNYRKEIDVLLKDVRALIEAGAQPTSPQGQELAQRCRDLCSRHALGDPVLYANWTLPLAVFFEKPAERKQNWEFLICALQGQDRQDDAANTA